MNSADVVNVLAYLSSGLMGMWVSIILEGRSIGLRVFSALVFAVAFNTILLAIKVS